jgi:hypothetical protein
MLATALMLIKYNKQKPIHLTESYSDIDKKSYCTLKHDFFFKYNKKKDIILLCCC